MNLKDIRDAMYAQADYGPKNSTAADSRMDAFINRAYNLIALEAPFLFFEDTLRFATEPDALTTVVQDTITFVAESDAAVPNANSWVVEQNNIGTAGLLTWPTDRSWDGRVIEIQDADGVWHRNVIRTVWQLVRLPPPNRIFMSFLMPWDTQNYTAGPFKYKVYTEEYSLPDDIIEVHSTRLWKTNNSWPLHVLGQDDAERQNILDKHTDLAKGIPRVVFRRTHYQMPAPAVPPAVEQWKVSQPTPHGWVGPEPAGTFEYKITYCWGARDIWFRNPGPAHWGYNAIDPVNQVGSAWDDIGASDRWGKQRYREPRWESAPSTVTAQVSSTNLTDQGVPGVAVRLTLPNIEYIQGFFWNLIAAPAVNPGVASPFSRQHLDKSGWFIRIYRRRVATNFTDYEDLGVQAGTVGVAKATGPILHKIEEDNSFYLLSEIHIDEANEGYFVDDGQLLPDYHRRLRDTHGYMQIGMYPVPNDRYEVEVRCVRRPAALTNNTDAPYIHAEACDLLVDRSLQLLYETEGNIGMMRLAKGRYDRNLLTLSKRYGDLRSSAIPMLKRLSRATPGYRTSMRYRQWWNSPK